MDQEVLTGKTRFRTGMFGKQILQVETKCRSYDFEGGGSFSPEFIHWRDAKSYEASQ